MKKKKKKKVPLRKRLKRKQRIPAAKEWINLYGGTNIIKDYADWFGVNEVCAVTELRMAGHPVNEADELKARHTVESRLSQKKISQARRKVRIQMEDEYAGYPDCRFEYIAGYTFGEAPYGIMADEIFEEDNMYKPYCEELPHENTVRNEIMNNASFLHTTLCNRLSRKETDKEFGLCPECQFISEDRDFSGSETDSKGKSDINKEEWLEYQRIEDFLYEKSVMIEGIPDDSGLNLLSEYYFAPKEKYNEYLFYPDCVFEHNKISHSAKPSPGLRKYDVDAEDWLLKQYFEDLLKKEIVRNDILNAAMWVNTSLEKGILLIEIDRPLQYNALNIQIIKRLYAVVTDLYTNREIHGAIITGRGKQAFAAGADIRQLRHFSAEKAEQLVIAGQALMNKIERCPKPVVASVNGLALGGGLELAMACHFRIASHAAKFGLPEVNLGLIPGFGGVRRLADCIGRGKAMEMMMTGDPADAKEALHLGLVNHITTPDRLITKTKDILNKIINKAPLSISGIIECVNARCTGDGYQKEIDSFVNCFKTADAKEGMDAFLEKRKAEFKGK